MTRDCVYTHQENTKVANLVKNRHDVESLKIAVNQAKFIFLSKKPIFQNWRVQMPNFICGLNNLSEVVSPPTAFCNRWLTHWENRLFHAKKQCYFPSFPYFEKLIQICYTFEQQKCCFFAWKSRFSQRVSHLLQIPVGGGTTPLKLFNPQTKFGICILQFWKNQLFR